MLTFPCSVKLAAGESFSLFLSCADANATVAVQLVPMPPVLSEDHPMRSLLKGEWEINSVGNLVFKGLWVMKFIPDYTGAPSGTLELSKKNGNDVHLTFLYQYDMANNTITVVKENGSASDIILYENAQGGLNYQDSGLKNPQPLVRRTAVVTPNNPRELTLGSNSVFVSDSFKCVDLPFTAPSDGLYTITAASGETNDNIVIGGEYIRLPYSFNLSAGQKITISVGAYSDNDTIDFVIERTGEKLPEKSRDLALGTNTVQVEKATVGGVEYTFQAPEAGTYRLVLVSGDLAVCIQEEDRGYSRLVRLELPYTFVLEDGESIALWIGTTTWKNTEVVFTIEKV